MGGSLGWPLLLFSSMVFSFALEDELEADFSFLTSELEGDDDELLVLLEDEPLEDEEELLELLEDEAEVAFVDVIFFTPLFVAVEDEDEVEADELGGFFVLGC